MKHKTLKEIEDLKQSQNEYLRKLHILVEEAINEEKLIMDSIATPPKEELSTADKISDKVALFGGSWKFIIAFAIVLFIWITYNVMVAKDKQFDPYPFILMNLILSCVAALQAPIIMMSQNRKEEKDRKRSENDYLVNLKAEIEIRNLHQKINLLMEEQIKKLIEVQAIEIKLLKELNEKIAHKK